MPCDKNTTKPNDQQSVKCWPIKN